MATIRIIHRPTATVLAEGPTGWGITRFDGGYYVRRRYLRTDGFRANGLPGICPYKFLYLWMDLHVAGGRASRLGWMYILPNPLLPFIWFRVALPAFHPDLEVMEP